MMIATKEKLQKLSDAASAKILVISDSHGRAHNLAEVLQKQKGSYDALVFLGDGAEDLLSLYEEDFSLPEEEKLFPPVTCFVRGNGDESSYSVYTSSLERIQIPENEVLTVCGKRIFLTHGHRFGVYYSTEDLFKYLEANSFDAGLFGHTHVPFFDIKNEKFILNPGSISMPRNHSLKSYAILSINRDKKEIKYDFYSIE